MNKFIISIVGPTGIGKTDLSLKLASHFQTEIISADSRQFFKEIPIGTAAPSNEELSLIPHHFIHHKSITETYSVGNYEKEVLDCIEKLHQKYDILIFGFSKCDETSDHQLNISNPILPTINLNYLGYFIGERLINSTSGALAYYLSVKAKKKISFLEEIYHVADDWNFYSDLGLKIGYIYPTLVIEDLNQFEVYLTLFDLH